MSFEGRVCLNFSGSNVVPDDKDKKMRFNFHRAWFYMPLRIFSRCHCKNRSVPRTTTSRVSIPLKQNGAIATDKLMRLGRWYLKNTALFTTLRDDVHIKA